jgi:predicted transcriptional regulator
MEIYSLLLENVDCMTANELQKAANKNPMAVRKCLRELLKGGYVESTKASRKSGPADCYKAAKSIPFPPIGTRLKKVWPGVLAVVPSEETAKGNLGNRSSLH